MLTHKTEKENEKSTSASKTDIDENLSTQMVVETAGETRKDGETVDVEEKPCSEFFKDTNFP